MSLNYNQANTSAQIEAAVKANPSVSTLTQLAITNTLGLGAGTLVNVGNVDAQGNLQQPTSPGAKTDMVTFTLGNTGGTFTPTTPIQTAIEQSKVLVFNTDRGVKFSIGPTATDNVDPSAQTTGDHSAQTISSDVQKLALRTVAQKVAADGQVFDRVVQLGNGNDDVTINDGKSTKIVGSGGDDKITLGNGNHNVSGGDGQDTILITGNGNNVIVSGWGVDTITGGKGRDVVVFTKAGTDTVNPTGTGATEPGKTGGDWTVKHNSDGTLSITSSAGAANGAVLKNVEFVQFGDAAIKTQFSVAVYNNESDANVTRLFQTVLDRSADDFGSQYWVDQYKSGNSLENITKWFLSTPESTLVTSQDNTAFITQMYSNAFGRAPDAAGLTFWLDALNKGVSRAVLVDYIATSTEAKTTITNVQVFTDWV